MTDTCPFDLPGNKPPSVRLLGLDEYDGTGEDNALILRAEHEAKCLAAGVEPYPDNSIERQQ